MRKLKLKNPNRIIAVVGPDGAGKSYTIDRLREMGNVVSTRHAMPITRWLPTDISNSVYFLVKEILNGIERNIIYAIVKLEKPDILDRCCIDGCAYSQLWSDRKKQPLIRDIAEAFNKYAPYPDVVIQLWLTELSKWNPKRKNFKWEDVQRLNSIYVNVLWEKGYRVVKKEHYYLGHRWYWRKYYDERRPSIYYRLKRKIASFPTRSNVGNRIRKMRIKFSRLRHKR